MSEYEKWKDEFVQTILAHPHNENMAHLTKLSLPSTVALASRAATSLNMLSIIATYQYVSESTVKRHQNTITDALSSYLPSGTEFHFTGEPLGAPVEIVINGVKHVLPYNRKLLA